MKCPYCGKNLDIDRKFQFTFIDNEGNWKNRTLNFSLGFGKEIEKSVSFYLHWIWECPDCGCLFDPPKDHIIEILKSEGKYKQ